MKNIHKAVSGALLLVLVSCGGNSTSIGESIAQPEVSTTIYLVADCSDAALSAGIGEPVSSKVCSGNWAAIQPEAYTESCNECESVWLYQWESATWKLRARCNQYSPLVAGDGSCSGMSGNISEGNYLEQMVDFPSKDDACVLWPVNRYPENTAMTGCIAE